jgi:glycosyltransferase involved in cell wall biosynthesis
VLSGGVIDPLKVTVIMNAPDERFFHPPVEDSRALRAAWGIAKDDLAIGVVGELIPLKGHLVFLEAFQQVVKRFFNVRAVLVGRDSVGYSATIRETADRLGIAERVVFTGFLHDMWAVYDALDIVVTPSHQEAFSLALAEAMSRGRPVIASAVGGMRELVQDGHNGFLVPAGDSNRLAETLSQVLADKDLRRRVGAAAMEETRRRFHPQDMVRAYEQVYAQVLAEHGTDNSLARTVGG